MARGEVVLGQLEDDGEEGEDLAGEVEGFLRGGQRVSGKDGMRKGVLRGTPTREKASISSLRGLKKGWNASSLYSGMNLAMLIDSTLSRTSVLMTVFSCA